MRIVRKLFTLLLLLLVLSGGLLLYVTATESGLQFAGRLLESRLGEQLRIGKLSGRLAARIEINDLRLQLNGDVYSVGHLLLDWSPWALASGELRIRRLDADAVMLSITPGKESANRDIVIDIDLPVTIKLDSADIKSLLITGLTDADILIDRITLAASAAGQQLDIQSLSVAAAAYQAQLAGVVGLKPARDSQLALHWQVELPGDSAFHTSGEANISGQLGAYRAEGSTSVSGKDIPPGQWQFLAAGNLEQLQIEQLQGETLEGQVSGQGALDWQQGFGWQLTLDVRRINPAAYWSEWPGELSAQVQSSGKISTDLQTGLQLQQLQGQLRGYPVAGQIDISLDNERLDIRQLDLGSGENRLQASGSVDRNWDISTEASLPDVAALLPGWTGALALSGQIQGPRNQPGIAARFSAQQLTGPSMAVTALSGEAQLSASESAPQSLQLQMQGVELAGQGYDEATLMFTGTIHRHQLRLDASGTDTRLDLRASGDWRDTVWQGEIQAADWELPGSGRWSLQRPVKAVLGTQTVQLAETCWLQASARLCLDARGNPQQQLSPTITLSRFPLQTLAALGDSSLTFSSLIDARLEASLDAGRLTQADLALDLGSGNVSYDDPQLPSESQIQGGEIRARLNPDGLTAHASLDLSDRDYLRATLKLPGYKPADTPWREQPLEMGLESELHDLLFLKYLLEEVGSYEGTVAVNLEGHGTLGQPRISGGATLADSRFDIDQLGIRLTGINLQLRSKADGLLLSGSCDSGKGSVQLSGEIDIVDIAHWQADVRLQGKDFEVMHLPEGIIEVSPDLRAVIAPPRLQLTGELHVPYARLRPKDLSTRAGVSSDVIIVDAEQVAEPGERWQVSSNIRLSLGDDVEIDGYGLKGDILGAVDLLDEPGKVTTAQGKLSIERGTYEVYGRQLEINRGQLLFSGGPVDNPGLDFEASRKVERVTAGIRASGTLRKPELTLYSDPAMSDSDIISYIAFGKPQAEAGQGGGSVTDAGILAGGNMLAGILGTKIGLEEFGVESGDTLDDAAMVLGTYLSPQLYVRYRTGLYDAINEFEVRYEFSRRWSIRTITSVATSSAEVQFSFER